MGITLEFDQFATPTNCVFTSMFSLLLLLEATQANKVDLIYTRLMNPLMTLNLSSKSLFPVIVKSVNARAVLMLM